MDYSLNILSYRPVAFKGGEEKVPKDEAGNIQLEDVDITETYAAMEKLVGPKVRAIGVSNFNIATLEKLAKTQKIVPAVNQVRRGGREREKIED